MKRSFFSLLAAFFFFADASAIVPLKHGGRLPEVYYEVKARNPRAFRMERAWVQKARRIKEQREAFLARSGIRRSSELSEDYKVSGTMSVPIMLGNFANTTIPYNSSQLQTELFDGPWETGTMAEYYSEISYGNLNLTGTVYNWVTVSRNDTYYEGTSYGTVPGNARTGEFIKEILDARDPTIDFSQYDNDGPDGVSNSGDDDGYVDFIAIVHSERGYECGSNSNIWSHSWVLRAWPELSYQPYTTNDPAAGGGFIKIDDYTIQPSKACNDVTMIEIGVFCHEFGHAFGLPDLYDTDGGSSGIGYWGVMGSGSWNKPWSPAHACAWSKKEMGWIVPSEVTWQGATESIAQAETNPVAYKFPFSDDRFRRIGECAISGSYSLRCGLTNAEGDTRAWKHSGGYGNMWDETVQRDFTFDGTGPVIFSYDYRYDMEANYDSAYTILSVAGDDTTLAAYTAMDQGTEVFDISPFLGQYSAPVGYTLRFRFVSDWGWSDEDGDYQTSCGALIVDNVGVSGGGEDYSTGFESSVDGWYQAPASNAASEYWLVENREAVGFDAYLRGQGLLIWHADDEVANSLLGNSGGGSNPTDQTVRGLVLEEADGNFDLLSGTSNKGDTGDPYPGSTGNTTFDALSNPGSNDNTNRQTMIEVSSISAAGATMSAYMRAGDPPPNPAGVSPDTLDNDLVSVEVIISGSGMRHGATFRFIRAGESDIVPVSIRWTGPEQISGNVDVYAKKAGLWTLVVTNPDGQPDTLPDALYLKAIVSTHLAFSSLKIMEGSLHLSFGLDGVGDGEEMAISRSASPDGPWFELAGEIRGVGGAEFEYVDRNIEPGRTYFYRLDLRDRRGEESHLFLGSTTVPSYGLALHQNHPNPFNPLTTISFDLPERMNVELQVFDVTGKLVRTLARGVFPAGPHRLIWNGRNEKGEPVGSGLYFYRLQAGRKKLTRKMLLVR